MNKLYQLTIHEAHLLLKERKISSVELTKSVLERIAEIESKVHSCVTIISSDIALKEAEAADACIARGDITPLTGIPTLIKDVICTKGIRTTCSSRMLENFIPPYDATVTTKVKTMGAVLLGKLNMDEFAMGSTTEHSAFQLTRNPWNRERIPGGSSGGSAAAVAADLCLDSSVCLDMGLAPGGRMQQEIYEDPFNLDDWEMDYKSRCFVHIANSLVWRSITGEMPPTIPFTSREYNDHGLPWFDYYSDNSKPLEGSDKLAGLKSVVQMGKEKNDNPLPENDSVEPNKVIKLRKGLKKGQVREGVF